jgi:hypothetical protein
MSQELGLLSKVSMASDEQELSEKAWRLAGNSLNPFLTALGFELRASHLQDSILPLESLHQLSFLVLAFIWQIGHAKPDWWLSNNSAKPLLLEKCWKSVLGVQSSLGLSFERWGSSCTLKDTPTRDHFVLETGVAAWLGTNHSLLPYP